MTEPCRILGILDNGVASLSSSALEHLRQAQLVIGGTRVLQLVETETGNAECRDLTGQLSAVPSWIADAQAAGKRTVVLATGDPLCHGIGKFLLGKLGRDNVEILSNLSTLQLAFARLGLNWEGAHICSVHSKDAGDWQTGSGPEHGLYQLLQDCRRHDLLAVFTSPENTPRRLARMLLEEGIGEDFQISVAQCLLQDGEQISADLTVEQAAALDFADPNMVILRRIRPKTEPVLFGLSDDSFQQRKPEKGLITKREVRALSLARLQLKSNSIIWDIGAGSGSVGLEAARLCPQGHVYAIEKNAEDAAIAAANRVALGISNYTLLHGKAPEGLENWPAPDAAFIGGSGGELAQLIELILQRLKDGGWLVMNFATVENLATAVETLKACGADWDITQLQAARSKPILDMHRLQAENPVWVVSARRGAGAASE